MKENHRTVGTVGQLLEAVADGSVRSIEVAEDLGEVPTIGLRPGQKLSGRERAITLRFAADNDGIALSADNTVADLRLITDPHRRAVFNDTSVSTFGRLELYRIDTIGCIRLIASDNVRAGHVEAKDVDVVAGDARGYDRRPAGYGVEVIPGVFTVWNQQADRGARITAELRGISVGREGAPVRGSGVFVAGAGNEGGQLLVSVLETGPVYSDGGIKAGTANRISGGVFTVSGAVVDFVHNLGPVSTYGANDMVLDNWGEVDRWIAEQKVTSYGPSAIGFVNFGSIDLLEVKAPIETFGEGSRGFNVYDGVVQSAEFERVVTRGNGSVGIQISRPVRRIAVTRGIETHGGVGTSLVKGVLTQLAATALSIKPGGSAHAIAISGGLKTHGAGIEPLELHGAVESLRISDGFAAEGGGFGGL
jgi:hypothetical protein